MRIAICSDIHDNIWKLEAMLQQASGCEALVFGRSSFAVYDMETGEGSSHEIR